MTAIHEEHKIKMIRLCALRTALGLEIKGMKRHGSSAYSILKQELGISGNRNSVYTQACEEIELFKRIVLDMPQ